MTINAFFKQMWLASALAMGSPIAATAGPMSCAKAHSAEQRAAITAAEAWHAHLWQHTGGGWTAAYQLMPPPALPLGMGSFKGGAAFSEGGTGGPSQPIRGVASVSKIVCTTYEVSPDQTFVVRFTGRQLSFNENAQGWSRPLPAALLQVLEVRPVVTPDASGLEVIPLTTARIALPPDAQLSLPAPSDVAEGRSSKRRR